MGAVKLVHAGKVHKVSHGEVISKMLLILKCNN